MLALSAQDHLALAMVRQSGNDGCVFGEAITQAQAVKLCALGLVEMSASIPIRVTITAKGAAHLKIRSFA